MDQQTNRYAKATASELHRITVQLIGDLSTTRTRTPPARSELVERTRCLLLVLSWRLHRPGMPATPEKALSTSMHPDVVREFAAFHASEVHEAQRAARAETIVRAADYVLGQGAWEWLHGQRLAPSGPLAPYAMQRHYQAIRSDERLMELLAELEAIRAAASIRQIA